MECGAHCLFGRQRTAEATSSCVTDRKSKKTQSVDVKLAASVLKVATRMSKTLSKNCGKLSFGADIIVTSMRATSTN